VDLQLHRPRNLCLGPLHLLSALGYLLQLRHRLSLFNAPYESLRQSASHHYVHVVCCPLSRIFVGVFTLLRRLQLPGRHYRQMQQWHNDSLLHVTGSTFA